MTTRKQLETILKETDTLKRCVFDAAPDAMLISNEQGVICQANKQAESLFGYQASEIIGQSIAFLMPERFRSMHNTRYFRFSDNDSAKLLSSAIHQLILPKDGNEFDVEISLNLFQTEQGRYIASAWRNITKTTKIEDQLRQSEARFKRMCNTSPSLMWMTDAEGKSVFINQTWLDFTGLELQDAMIPKGWLKVIHPDDKKKVLSTYYEDIGQNKSITKEYRLRHNSGDWRWILDKGMPIYNENGIFDGYIGSASDITEHKLVEEQLHASATRIQAVLNTVVDGIITIQQGGIIDSINPAAERIFGYASSEVIGQNINMLMPEPYHSEHDGYLQHYQKTGEKKIIGIGREVQGKRKNGIVFPMELAVSEMTIDGKQMFSGVVRDITERRNFETTIRNSEVRYRSVIDAVLEGIITINEHGLIASMNPAAETIFGYKESEVSKHNIKMLMPEPYHSKHDGYLHQYLSTGIAKIIGTGREVKGLRKNGEIFPMELSVSEIQLDKQRMFIGLVKDISDIKQAEKLQSQFSAIIESSDDAIISKTVKGIITSWNTAAEIMFGYSAQEAIGQPMTIIFPVDRLEEEPKILEQIANGERIEHFETVRLTKSGKPIDISATISPIKDKAGQIIGVSIIAREITERKKIDKMKNEFISTVSHELRTPLTSIQGSLELILSGTMGEIPQDCTPLLEIANNNSSRLVRLINDILDIEKIESGNMEFTVKPIEIMSVVQQTLDANQAYADEYGVKLVKTSQINCYVIADHDRLIQVLTNLISNAVKFSPKDEAVEVGVALVKSNVRVSVTDYGSGIPDEFRDRIFTKFSQADASSTKQQGGTGLGLSICKAIVEKLGGQIHYESEINKKTCFYFELPVYRHQTDSVNTELDTQSDTILICEDDPDVANLLKLMLEKKGYSTDIAYSAEQAKQKLFSKPYAAMTLDLMLPGQSGIDFFKELRGPEGISDIPVIVISAIADKTKAELKGDALSISDWLDKPIDQSRLESAISQAIANKTANHFRILHIEDDPDIVTLVKTLLKNKATVDVATDLQTAKLKLQQDYDLVILDLMLPDGSGSSLLSSIAHRDPPLPVIVFSAKEESEELTDCVNARFIKSKTSNEDLLQSIERMLNHKIKPKKE